MEFKDNSSFPEVRNSKVIWTQGNSDGAFISCVDVAK